MDTKTLLPKMYISLPMTGIENNNSELELKAFNKARKMGYWVYSPSRIALAVNKKIEKPEYKHYLGFDLWSLSLCDAMLLCPGWESSKGCKIEVNFALENGIPIYDYCTEKIYEWKDEFDEIKLRNNETYEKLLVLFSGLCIIVLIITSILFLIHNIF